MLVVLMQLPIFSHCNHTSGRSLTTVLVHAGGKQEAQQVEVQAQRGILQVPLEDAGSAASRKEGSQQKAVKRWQEVAARLVRPASRARVRVQGFCGSVGGRGSVGRRRRPRDLRIVGSSPLVRAGLWPVCVPKILFMRPNAWLAGALTATLLYSARFCILGAPTSLHMVAAPWQLFQQQQQQQQHQRQVTTSSIRPGLQAVHRRGDAFVAVGAFWLRLPWGCFPPNCVFWPSRPLCAGYTCMLYSRQQVHMNS